MNAAQEMIELNAEDDEDDEDAVRLGLPGGDREKDCEEYWQWVEERGCYVRWDRRRREYVYSTREQETAIKDSLWMVERFWLEE